MEAWYLLKIYFFDGKPRLKDSRSEDSTPEDVLEKNSKHWDQLSQISHPSAHECSQINTNTELKYSILR